MSAQRENTRGQSPISILVAFAAILGACGGGDEISVEEFCAAREDSGCLEMRGETYEFCLTIEASSWEQADETGCQSVHQAAVACLVDELAAGGCPGGGASEMCDMEIAAVRACFEAP